jgi:Protein of unknown function (DUF1566)
MRARALLPTVVMLTLTIAARGDAPPDQYKTFLPTTPTISDNYTQLVWTRSTVAGPINTLVPANAESACSGVGLGGKWRLPTVRELLTIVDEQPHLEHDSVSHADITLYIDGNAFPGMHAARYVAASPDPLNALWFVDFGNGNAGVIKPDNQTPYFVLCVQY